MDHSAAPDRDTIAAIATAPGRGGVGIVRLTGPAARSIGMLITGTEFKPRHAGFARFSNHQQEIDSGIVLYFQGPNSFTGEDVIELQGHGGPVIMDMLLAACIAAGARLARPGEFSERAYLNGRMDLTQAEAVADLINSSTEQAAINAMRSLQGAFSLRINELVAAVTSLRVYVEAAIDFPEEEIDFLQDGQVARQLGALITRVQDVLVEARQGSLIQEGMKLVIAGRPNAGKSSLLNALAGQDSAIVTPIPGTTRDVLREHIQINGMPLHIVDTAGLRDSDDPVEQEGIRRAWGEIESADRILLVVDSATTAREQRSADKLWPEYQDRLGAAIPVTIVLNKCDLTDDSPGLEEHGAVSLLHLSARTGAGIDLLRQHLSNCMGYSGSGEGRFSARRRHVAALERAEEFLLSGQQQLLGAGAGELLAEDLRACQDCLGEITGAVSSDQLLGEIFSSFCIGK